MIDNDAPFSKIYLLYLSINLPHYLLFISYQFLFLPFIIILHLGWSCACSINLLILISLSNMQKDMWCPSYESLYFCLGIPTHISAMFVPNNLAVSGKFLNYITNYFCNSGKSIRLLLLLVECVYTLLPVMHQTDWAKYLDIVYVKDHNIC